MSNTIKNFLVGVGLDTKDFDKGSKNVVTNLSRFRSLSLAAGAAMIGAFSMAGTSAIAAGGRIDKFVLSTERLSASTGFIYNYGNALRSLGGDASEAVSAVTSIDKALDDLRLKGEFGAFSEAAFARADVNALSRAANAEEFLRISAEIVPTLDKQQQRLFQESFALSNATMRSLQEGPRRFDEMINRAGRLTGSLGDSIDASREFNKELSEFNQRMEGIGNTLAGTVLPAFTGILEAVNGFIDNSKGQIQSVADITAKSPVGATLAAAGVGASATGAALSGVGLRGIGAGVSRLGGPATAVGLGMMAWDVKPDDIEGLTGMRPSDYIFDTTPVEGARDLYNYAGGNSVKGEGGAFDYLGGSYGRVLEQQNKFGEGLLDKFNNRRNGAYEDIIDGAVTNTEAAQSDPGVIMMMNRENAHTPRPQQTKIQNNLEIKLEMDGRSVETKVIDVLERRDQATIDDMQSTTVR